VKAAVAKKDRVGLEDACEKWPGSYKNLACGAAVGLAVEEKNLGVLNDMCKNRGKYKRMGHWGLPCNGLVQLSLTMAGEELASVPCDAVLATWEKHKDALKRSIRVSEVMEAQAAVVTSFGVKLAQCGEWDYLFENVIHGQRPAFRGNEALAAIDKAGLDLEKEMLGYMARHKANLFTFKHAGDAIEHYFTFLGGAEKYSHCSKYIPFADNIASDDFFHFNYFFRASDCSGVLKIIDKRLASDDVADRLGACATLAKFGSKRDLKKLEIVASSDPHYKTKKRVKIYHVRDDCRAAIGKIKLRGK
jgi:hypothetical protein